MLNFIELNIFIAILGSLPNEPLQFQVLFNDEIPLFKKKSNIKKLKKFHIIFYINLYQTYNRYIHKV